MGDFIVSVRVIVRRQCGRYGKCQPEGNEWKVPDHHLEVLLLEKKKTGWLGNHPVSKALNVRGVWGVQR